MGCDSFCTMSESVLLMKIIIFFLFQCSCCALITAIILIIFYSVILASTAKSWCQNAWRNDIWLCGDDLQRTDRQSPRNKVHPVFVLSTGSLRSIVTFLLRILFWYYMYIKAISPVDEHLPALRCRVEIIRKNSMSWDTFLGEAEVCLRARCEDAFAWLLW